MRLKINEKKENLNECVKKNGAITLIALVITIVILLILVGVSIKIIISGEIIKKAQKTVVAYEENEAREKLEIVLANLKIDKQVDKNYNKEEYLEEKLESQGIIVIEDTAIVDGWSFGINKEELKIEASLGKNIQENYTNHSLIGKISSVNYSKYQKIEISGKIDDEVESKEYNTNIVVYNKDLVLDGINNVPGAKLENNKYEFGNEQTDVATEDKEANNMVILKVNGNLTINENVTLTTCKSEEGYGGPKGLLIYCKGILTNKGTISMTRTRS